MTPDQIAHVAHAANRAVQIVTGDPAPSPSWEDAEDWQRESAFDGVAAALQGRSPAEQHAAWAEHKTRDGWTYGPVKDAVAKTHPCLVAYEDLPAEQIAKDRLFVAVVAALSA